MTTLSDVLDEAVADVHADLPALTSASRKQGLGIRRRRQALAAVGSAAAVTALVAGCLVVLGGTEDSVAVDVANPVRVGQLSGETAPATDEAVVAALVDAVDQVADGTYGRFQGEAWEHESYAAILFLPVDGTGPAGQLFINLQPAKASRPDHACESFMADCAVRDLPDGAMLRTYREDDDTEFGTGSQRLVAEVRDPARRLRVVVGAMNTNPWEAGHYRDRPVLTTEQLVEIATQPWWGRSELPVEYVDASDAIELYRG